MSRLIIVSNRVMAPSAAACPGGLASGLLDALHQVGGIWFGWNGKVDESTAALERQQAGNITFVTTSFTPRQYQQYYCRFANGVLWPSFHYRTDLAHYDRQDYEGYRRVNEMLALKLKPLLQDDDVLWVQDYYLIPFATACRQLGVHNRIGFFLHIPFPCVEVARTIPMHQALFGCLADYDLVGFQTAGDQQAFLDHARRFGSPGATPTTGVYPIGIQPQAFTKMAEAHVAERSLLNSADRHHGRQAILGIDRLDYSKGLHERFQAYEQLLDRYPKHHRRVQFIQIAPITRQDIDYYRHIHERLNTLTGRINGRFGDLDWLPLRYINQDYTRDSLAGLMRQARVGFVTPLRDGMNLVAKEYVAAQSEQDPGVLILSSFAGAAHELSAALIVNPYDRSDVSAALNRALTMSLEERQERHRAMLVALNRTTIDRWHSRFLSDLNVAHLAHANMH